MLLKDKLQIMSKKQLVLQIKRYENQIEDQKNMPESVKGVNLFGSPIENSLVVAQQELASRT